MSKFSWRRGFAVGLTIGITGTLILVLFGDQLYDLGKCISKSEHCRNTQTDEHGNEPEWWYWTRRLLSAEDTLAQWIMAFFTICATIVLIFT